jgi:three-Cys-motif partner protein
MDTNGDIHNHSKIKLELYRLYLERYLSVLLVATSFQRINVIDVLAGKGISENGERGSALIAADTIHQVKTHHNSRNKTISLLLNDADESNYADLKKHLSHYKFVSINRNEANAYIESWEPVNGTHHLFFIDPHGYTQVSTENLKRLFSTQHCDFLIFIPISHIYRFLKPSGSSHNRIESQHSYLEDFEIDSKKRKTASDNLTHPYLKFLNGLGIDNVTAQSSNNEDHLARLITSALKLLSEGYAYYQMLENDNRNCKYALFFISKNILGAEKFLEAQETLKSKQAKVNYPLFQFLPPANPASILPHLSVGEAYDNVKLYELGINAGILPAQLNAELRTLESNQRIFVQEIPGQQRQSRGYYINNKYFKINDRRITIERVITHGTIFNRMD